MKQGQPTLRIAIDTGGTFTDCVWISDGQIRMLKVLSTPADPSQAIAEAISKIATHQTLILLHGTTVGTNTILQRNGGKVALVTTSGFEDAIEIGRQARPQLYNLFFDRVAPLVDTGMRFGAHERTDATGKILESPTRSDLQRVLDSVRKSHPESVAISFLFSFANPHNERMVHKALSELDVPFSISHEILPEFREFERTSTVVVNAYLQPVMERYLAKLQQRLSPSNNRNGSAIFVMQSSGGITTLAHAARQPVRTVLSGPAGGVVGAAATARRSGFDRIISFDMGGTSTDVALIDREIRASSQSEVASLPVGVPMLDIHTVGAGGGSIARFDAAGALRVGPESAGADPGPICYGRGLQPTVTDANLLLGRLQPNRFLGGNFQLDFERTRQIVGEWLKKQLPTMTLQQFASGVIRVVNSTMEKAVRVVSIERGYDPREFTLVAFGGAGGLHACELAESLSIPRVIVPAMPGALSAFGILVSDVVKDAARTVLWRVNEALPAVRLSEEFKNMQATIEREFRSEKWTGRVHHAASVDTRYRGQGYELNVPFTADLLNDFHQEHRRRYGYEHREKEVELVTLRLRSTLKSPNITAKLAVGRSRSTAHERGRSPVFLQNKVSRVPIYVREQMRAAQKQTGPAIVTEYSATSVIAAGWDFSLDREANLLIEAKPRRRRPHIQG
jgi:N-methylhydantoinase A